MADTPKKKRLRKTPLKHVRLTQEQLLSLVSTRSDKEIADAIRDLARAGRPPKALDVEKIAMLRSLGCSIAEIAAELGVSEKNIDRKKQNDPAVARAFEQGQLRGNVRLRKAKFAKAVIQQDTGMLIWESKQRLGEKDHHTVGNEAGEDGKVVPFQIVISKDESEF